MRQSLGCGRSPRTRNAHGTEVLAFLAGVMSVSRGQERDGQLNGLSLKNADQWSAGAVQKHKPTPLDFDVFQQLDQGFRALETEIARACLARALVADDADSSWLLKAPAHHGGAFNLAYYLESAALGGTVFCPKCGQYHDAVWKGARWIFEAFLDDDDPFSKQRRKPDPEQTARERQVARDLAAHFPPDHKVARFLTAWADWNCCDG